MSVVETFRVAGMSCDHCIAAISGEIGTLPGVVGVAVDLPTGAVVVTSESRISPVAIAAAVDEAGYQLVIPA